MDKKIPVLFMDDEAISNKNPVVKDAIKALENNGCEVKVCLKISEALEAFYKSYYKVFILDIDMHKVKDTLNDRGTKAAKVFRSLNSNSSIIMFSAAGKDYDWFNLSQYGISRYIRKEEDNSIQKLVDTVKELSNKEGNGLKFPKPKNTGKIAIVVPNKDDDLKDNLPKLVKETNNNYEPVLVDLNGFNSYGYIAIIVAAHKFSTKKSKFEEIKKIIKDSKDAHVVLVSGSNGAVVDYLNLLPFRIVNLDEGSWANNLKKAINDATYWYGAPEVIDSDEKDFKPIANSIDWDSLDDSLDSGFKEDN